MILHVVLILLFLWWRVLREWLFCCLGTSLTLYLLFLFGDFFSFDHILISFLKPKLRIANDRFSYQFWRAELWFWIVIWPKVSIYIVLKIINPIPHIFLGLYLSLLLFLYFLLFLFEFPQKYAWRVIDWFLVFDDIHLQLFSELLFLMCYDGIMFDWMLLYLIEISVHPWFFFF